VAADSLPIGTAAHGAVTYHDPCYLGRHNGVVDAPRELLAAIPGMEFREMERHGERSFCRGAGGAGMWQSAELGERINDASGAGAGDRSRDDCHRLSVLRGDARGGCAEQRSRVGEGR